MRTLTIADGHGTVRVDRNRATVRVDGQFLGQLIRVEGRWITPTGETYDAPGVAAEDLAEAGYAQAA